MTAYPGLIFLLHSPEPRSILARLFVMGGTNSQFAVGRASLPGHPARASMPHQFTLSADVH